MRFSLNQYPRLTLLPGGPVKSSESGWWVCTSADDLSAAVRTWGSLKRTILLLHKALSVRTFIRIKQMNRQALHANEWQAIFHLFYLHIMLLTLEKVGIRLDLSVRLPDGSAQEKTGNWSRWLPRRRSEFGNKQFQALHVISREMTGGMEMSCLDLMCLWGWGVGGEGIFQITILLIRTSVLQQ